MEEENILNKVSFVTLYYSWRYRGGDLWRLRGASTTSNIPITKNIIALFFFLSNCSLPKEHFNIKYIYIFFNSTYGETEVDLHGEMWVMGFLHISAYKSITIKPKKKKL